MTFTRRTQLRGFTLLEVLVALLVLSLGLLGLAGLQTLSLKHNSQSYFRTQATIQAYDIVDRMRANRTLAGVVNANYANVGLGAQPNSPDCAQSACSSDDLAAYDIRVWNSGNARLLPNGAGQIVSNGALRTITLQWVENELPMSLIVQVQL